MPFRLPVSSPSSLLSHATRHAQSCSATPSSFITVTAAATNAHRFCASTSREGLSARCVCQQQRRGHNTAAAAPSVSTCRTFNDSNDWAQVESRLQAFARPKKVAASVPPGIAAARNRVEQRLDGPSELSGGGARRGTRSQRVEPTRELRFGEACAEADSIATAQMYGNKGKERQRDLVSDAARSSHITAPSLDAFGRPLPSSLPATPRQLTTLLKHISATYPRPSPSYIASLHAHPALAHLVSSESYALVLDLAVRRASNAQLVAQLLEEMEERGIARSEGVWRAILHWELRRGRTGAVSDVVAVMKKEGWTAWPLLNWRRNLGVMGKGRGDRQMTWKGQRPVKDGEKAVNVHTLPKTQAQSGKGTRSSDSTMRYDPLDGLLRRQPTRAPRDVTVLPPADIAALVDSYIQDQSFPEALRAAETWLRADAAKQAESMSRSARVRPRTAIVLLNILLKGLVVGRAVDFVPVQRQFVLDFVARHSMSGEAKVVPGLTTLRTLVSSLQRQRDGWRLGLDTVNWFREQFGGTSVAPLCDTAPSSSRLDATLASLLLRLAMADLDYTPKSRSSPLISDVRAWWSSLDKVPKADTDPWLARQVKVVELDAVESGLLELSQERTDVLAPLMRTRRRMRRKEAERRAEEAREKQAREQMRRGRRRSVERLAATA